MMAFEKGIRPFSSCIADTVSGTMLTLAIVLVNQNQNIWNNKLMRGFQIMCNSGSCNHENRGEVLITLSEQKVSDI